MKPVRFEYRRVASLDEAIAILSLHGDEAKILAGGQSLGPLLNMRLARPALLVDINPLSELEGIRVSGDVLTIGALVRHSALVTSPVVALRAPLLAQAARHVGHQAIRNRGTLGGSLAHADPAAEFPAVMVALDATFIATGPGGRRAIPAEDFFQGPYVTVLAADEILIEIELPTMSGIGWGFAEVARRPGDFALAGICCTIGGSRGPRAVAFGVGDTPIRLLQAETVLGSAKPIDASLIAQAASRAPEACDPPDDLHSSGAYRRHLVSVLTERALLDARG